jgi:hypothetical protein
LLKIRNVLIVLFLLCYFSGSAFAAGEENVKIVKANGTETKEGIEKTKNVDKTVSSDGSFFGIQKSDADLSDIVAAPLEGVKYLFGVPILREGSQLSTGIIMVLGIVSCIVGVWYCVFRMGMATWLKRSIEEIIHHRKVMFELVIGLICAFGLTGLIVYVSGAITF